MSSVIGRSLSLRSTDETSTEHVGIYGTATSPMNLNLDASLYGCLAFNVKGTTEGIYTLNDTGKSILFPNVVANPTKADFYSRMCARRDLSFGSATSAIKLKCNGTIVSTLSVQGPDLTDKSQADIAESALTTMNKSGSVSIGLNATDGKSSTQANVIRASITLYFVRYDFSALAGSNVSSASVSSSTGYNGDTVTYSCVLARGATFDGWYNGSTRVSTSQSYAHTVNSADITLTAQATAPSEPVKSFSVIYNNDIIINQDHNSNVSIVYNNGTIGTLTDNDRVKNLQCKNKCMATAVTAGGRTLNCGNKVPSCDIPMLYCNGTWELNKGLVQGTSTLSDASGFITTPYIPVSGQINVTVGTGGTRSGSMLNEYNASFGYASYWGHSAATRTFTLDTAASYIRCTFLKSGLANCYIYDNTNGKYLYKGGNV